MTVREVTDEANSKLAAQVSALRQDIPGVAITTRFVTRSPTRALVKASQRAGMLVLGSRGEGGFSQLLLGSVTWRAVARAVCPVVVVRPDDHGADLAAGSVLVGIDGSRTSRQALAFALDEASSRRTGLIAVNVWAVAHPEGLEVGRDWPVDDVTWRAQMESDANRILSEALAGTGEQYPDVAVTAKAVHGFNVSQTLLEVAASSRAGLVVVGARGRHAFGQLLLGAVGVQMAFHADRPLAVVHS